MPRIDLDIAKTGASVEGTALVKIGSLPHSFPDGDPVLKQFFLIVTMKDAKGMVLAEDTQHFGLPYEKILRGPIPDSFIKGGNTRKVPFAQKIPAGSTVATVEAVLSYSLIPTPDAACATSILPRRQRKGTRRSQKDSRRVYAAAYSHLSRKIIVRKEPVTLGQRRIALMTVAAAVLGGAVLFLGGRAVPRWHRMPNHKR